MLDQTAHATPTEGWGDPAAQDPVTHFEPRPPGSRWLMAPAMPSGAALGRYIVLGPIGPPSPTRVVRAYDPKLRREVALRRVTTGQHDDRALSVALQHARLSHPNVVHIYDVESTSAGELLVVMEYIDGIPLSRWLTTRQPTRTEILRGFVAAGAVRS